MSILFSPIGESDPIRNNYDGPMLHILRNYKDIDKCYLFLTKRMRQNYENGLYQNVLEDFEKKSSRNITYEYILSDIIQANDFDIYYSPFMQQLKRIRELYPEQKIYLNVSSGTPQMGTTLALIACESNISNTLAIQVSRPTEDVKKGSSAVDVDYDIEFEKFFNFDNESKINRCSIVNLVMIVNNNIKERVNSLLESYDYQNAYIMYKNSPLFEKRLATLIQHLEYRQTLEIEKAKAIVKENTYSNQLFLRYLTNGKDYRKNRILEYYLLLKNLLYSNRINDFIIRFCSYCEELLKELIDSLFGYHIEHIFGERNNDKFVVSSQKILNYSKQLYDYVQNRFNGNYQDSHFNIEILNVILKYELEKNNIVESEFYCSVFEYVEQLKKYRHISAHKLEIVTIEQLKCVCDIYGLMENIKKILIKIYPDLNQKYFSLYENTNNYIKKEMR